MPGDGHLPDRHRTISLTFEWLWRRIVAGNLWEIDWTPTGKRSRLHFFRCIYPDSGGGFRPGALDCFLFRFWPRPGCRGTRHGSDPLLRGPVRDLILHLVPPRHGAAELSAGA